MECRGSQQILAGWGGGVKMGHLGRHVIVTLGLLWVNTEGMSKADEGLILILKGEVKL